MPPIDTKIREHLTSLIERGRNVVRDKGHNAGQASAGVTSSSAATEASQGIDFEHTITEMVGAIQAMESQLSHVLEINALLERDLNQAKERVRELRLEREKLLATIARLEEEMPSKRELQMVIDQFIEERSNAEITIRDLRRRDERITSTFKDQQDTIQQLENERKEMQVELASLEARLETVTSESREQESKAQVLARQTESDRQAIKELESDLRIALDEKFKISAELDEARRALAAYQTR
jgi:chromosome segregation ATPase